MGMDEGNRKAFLSAALRNCAGYLLAWSKRALR